MKIGNKYLFIGGVLSLIASLLHIAIIIGGPDWYRFFGAGEEMAQLAENKFVYSTAITLSISLVLALWAIYAFSGTGVVRRVPLVRLGLVIISTIYLARGVFGIPLIVTIDDPYFNELKDKMTFMVVSSLTSLVLGLFYVVGTWQIWPGNAAKSA